MATTATASGVPQVLLSKSDFKAASSCPTSLFYRKLRYPSASQEDEFLQQLAVGGYMVEQLAKALYSEGITIDRSGGHAAAAAETLRLLATNDAVTLFEATFMNAGRLARIDILRKQGTRLELLEVKSSLFDQEDAEKRLAKTRSCFRSLRAPHGIESGRREYLEDVAFQYSILRDVFTAADIAAFLVLVDKRYACPVDGLPGMFRVRRRPDGRLEDVVFTGDAAAIRADPITIALDVTAEVLELEVDVRTRTADFRASLQPVPGRIPPLLVRGCVNCEYVEPGPGGLSGFDECWRARAERRPLVLELSHGKDLIDELLEEGVDCLLDVSPDRIGGTGAHADRQRIQLEHTITGTEWLAPELGPALRLPAYPLHFIDFEAGRLAIPHHAGMRPYGVLAFQWSCHTLEQPDGPLIHREWLNTDDPWPNRAFAESLRAAIGGAGTVLTWSPFEATILRSVADDMDQFGPPDPGLREWLADLGQRQGGSSRVLDLHRLCAQYYFHPAMGRRTSIKFVLDAIWRTSPEVWASFERHTGCAGDPELGPYAALPPIAIADTTQVVADGGNAVRAYETMMYGPARQDAAARTAWRQLLLQYCRLDTLAMVLVWEHWMRNTAGYP